MNAIRPGRGGTEGRHAISRGLNAKSYLYVVELDPAVEEKHQETIERYNPGRDPSAPHAYVKHPHPAIRFANGFDESKIKIVRRWGRSLRADDECTGHATGRLQILKRVERTIVRLRGIGWTILNAPTKRTYSVYVCELHEKAGKGAKARKENPKADPSMPVVYVGQTSLTPDERIRQHLGGGKTSSSAVERHFKHMLPGLYEHLNLLTELESLRRERSLGAELRRCGYTVLGAR